MPHSSVNFVLKTCGMLSFEWLAEVLRYFWTARSRGRGAREYDGEMELVMSNIARIDPGTPPPHGTF